jgi:aspartate/tyrosine/aromatic aminotransferase
MFENVDTAPPDAIFGLNEALRRDARPHKINLGAGVYKNEAGETPVLAAVKEAEGRILDRETSKSYLPIDGLGSYAERVRQLHFGDESEILADRRAVTAQAPGGTGALRVAGDFLKTVRGDACIWMSDPTWANHPQIYDAVGLRRKSYPYFDPATHGLAFDRMLAVLERAPEGDLVLLHGCCHNPSGVDPTAEQWSEIGELLAARRLFPVVDFAYQGFARGVEEDVEWLRVLCRAVPELMVCASFSKNFGLYNERVGALTVVAADAGRAAAVLSQVKRTARANYSNPPAHGAAIVDTVLGDPELRAQWEAELDRMRRRIQRMRRLLAAGLDQRGVRLHPDGNGFIVRQNGMFSFSGLGPEQVETLRREHAIYLVGSGRINVAGVTEANVDRLCDAIAAVR